MKTTAFDPAAFSTYTSQTAALIVGIGMGILIHAKLWWGSKSKEQKKALVSDLVTAVEDGKLTAKEATVLIKEHL